MKLANERVVGRSVPVTKELDIILMRLDRLSMTPGFAQQRRIAFTRALQVYVELGSQAPLSPLPEEVGLADLLLYADFYPEDGQLTLIEQLRDVITGGIYGRSETGACTRCRPTAWDRTQKADRCCSRGSFGSRVILKARWLCRLGRS